VLLGEPPRTQYDLNFSLFGIPVRVHPLFWLVTLLLNRSLHDVGAVLTWMIAVFLAILVHELGHAAVMRIYGFRPSIALYAFGGLTSYSAGLSFRSRSLGAWSQILISFAGPGAGFLLTAVMVGILMLTVQHDQIAWAGPWNLIPQVWLSNVRLAMVLDYVFLISMLWGLLNLLPIFPLDGGQIARELLLKANPYDGIRQSLMLSMVAAVGMAAYFVMQQSVVTGIFFGYLAYSNYITMQGDGGRGPW
jgi:stage IV sporulation protein FB